jgi:predicted dehydrogenase
VPVEVATHAAGTMEFVSGALVTMVMSFDVARHRHAPIELYGTDGAMIVPDPNFFDGKIELATAATIGTAPIRPRPRRRTISASWASPTWPHAIANDRPHRASGDLAFHVLEVMEAFQKSSDTGMHVEIATRPERPAMMPVP